MARVVAKIKNRSKIIMILMMRHGLKFLFYLLPLTFRDAIRTCAYCIKARKYNTASQRADDIVENSVLIVDHFVPRANQDAGSVATINQLKIFKQLGYQVCFMPMLQQQGDESYLSELKNMGVEILLAASPMVYLQHHAEKFKMVFIYRYPIARLLKKTLMTNMATKFIINPADLFYLRQQRFAKLMRSALLDYVAKRIKTEELAILQKADAVVVHSHVEKKLLDIELKQTPVTTLPIFVELMPTPAAFNEREGILFLGNYQHQPNVDAVTFFVNEIYPLIKQRIPNLHFYIVGSHPTAAVKALVSDGITVTGQVEDLYELMNQVKIAVAPLRFGAGMKGKLCTTMAYGLPTIASSMATEGMNVNNEKDILVADTVATWVESIKKLLTDSQLWTVIRANAYTYIEQYHTLSYGVDITQELVTLIQPSSK